MVCTDATDTWSWGWDSSEVKSKHSCRLRRSGRTEKPEGRVGGLKQSYFPFRTHICVVAKEGTTQSEQPKQMMNEYVQEKLRNSKCRRLLLSAHLGVETTISTSRQKLSLIKIVKEEAKARDKRKREREREKTHQRDVWIEEQEPTRIPKQTDTCEVAAAVGIDRQKGQLV